MSTDETTRPRLDEIEARAAEATALTLGDDNASDCYHIVEDDVPALTAALRDVLAAVGPHWNGQVRREAKFGRTGSPCVCEICNAYRAITAHIDVTAHDLTDTRGTRA